ncbi:MAG TPA: Ig-like domain-containing protein [Bacteroidales bacterium]|nr:Ig-like domain-containing protein [Bacteroidales bacterium]
MDIKDYFKKHLFAILLVFIAIQLIIFALVQNFNHKPRAVADSTNVIEDRSTKISPLANDEDKDERDILKLASVSKAHHGSVSRKVNALVYTPAKNFTGTDSLTYTVTDGKKESLPATIVFHVLKNQAPVANNDAVSVYSGGVAAVYAIDNDEDKEKDSLHIHEVNKPKYGDVTVSEKILYYKTTNGTALTDSFTYTISDGHHVSKPATVKINILKKGNPCYPWLLSDIGEVSKPGSVICQGKTMMIQASGSDIWNNADGFYFVYQIMNKDCEIVAKIETIEGINEWTKSGLMIRENLSANSKNVFLGLTTKHGVISQARIHTGESSDHGKNKSELKAPYWIKINREGDIFRFTISADGQKWESLEDGPITMAENVYVGIAVTSHDNSALCKTVLSNLSIKGKIARLQ